MLIGTIQCKIFLPNIHNLKEKRAVVKSLIKRVQNKFHVSVAEVDELDKWQIAVIGVAAIGNERRIVDQQLTAITQYIENEQMEYQVLDVFTEII